ncbi:unnamed protein product [Peniophora sp. CBMAI 1063]|nr:unnamed protein product [Peniophora sp. CBMAI 1063]
MSDQQPRKDPKKNLAIDMLPTEIWFRILGLLFDDYFAKRERKGRRYLPQYIASPIAPFNTLPQVCKRLRDLVRALRGVDVTMLHPKLTRNCLAGLQENESAHFVYTDAGDWAPFEHTSDFPIPDAVKLALDELPKARTLTMFAQISTIADFPMSPIPGFTGLSNVERVELLAESLQELSTRTTPALQQLHIYVESNMKPEDNTDHRYGQVQRTLHVNEKLFWTRGADLFPALEDLAVTGLLCTVRPRLPPSLTKLELSRTFTGMDDLLEMLKPLSRLRDLALSDCARRLPSMAPDRHAKPRESVRLLSLQKLVLQERLPALVTIFSHLEFRPTTSMELSNHVDDTSDHGVNAAEAIRTLAREVQSRLDPERKENASVFEALKVKLSEPVGAFDLHGRAGNQTVDICFDQRGIQVTTA